MVSFGLQANALDQPPPYLIPIDTICSWSETIDQTEFRGPSRFLKFLLSYIQLTWYRFYLPHDFLDCNYYFFPFLRIEQLLQLIIVLMTLFYRKTESGAISGISAETIKIVAF